MTGRGGDIIIVDDPLKASDALSDIKRERVNDWFNDTLLSRLNDKQCGVIVVVTQRLHVHDLVGALLDGPLLCQSTGSLAQFIFVGVGIVL